MIRLQVMPVNRNVSPQAHTQWATLRATLTSYATQVLKALHTGAYSHIHYAYTMHTSITHILITHTTTVT
jgi:hypothetical protein